MSELSPPGADIQLNRDVFMRRLIASLGHLNEGILGSDVAGAYVMNVGLSMGAAIEDEYKHAWGIDRPFTLDEYAFVIVDLKQRIQGNFSLVSKDPNKVVVRTTSCPFDEFVRQSPSLCFMTSSVFGGIAARNFGYAKTVLHNRIALGDPGCYVTVHLRKTPEAEQAVGREYFPDVDRANPDIAQQLRLMDNVRRLKRQLQETSSRWEELVRGAADAVAIFDLDGVISFANARWREQLGVEGGELVGQTIDHLVPEEEQELLATLLREAFGGARLFGRHCRLRHRHGEWRALIASFSPIRDEQGAIAGVLGIFHDVTEEQEAQRLKDHFVTSAAHELRTPLTTIKAQTEVLLRGLQVKGRLDHELLSRRLNTIRREADRLALLSSELFDVANLQQGKLPVKRSVSDLNRIAVLCVEHQREIFGDALSHTITFAKSSAPLSVHIEPGRLEQVITNLLNNAVKYSPEGGPIAVVSEQHAGSAQLRISDRGVGIPEQDLPNIFTPFFRASNVSADTFMGLGLGLYLSRAIAEAHGGRLWIDSVEGRGTTVTLVLPLSAGSSD